MRLSLVEISTRTNHVMQSAELLSKTSQSNNDFVQMQSDNTISSKKIVSTTISQITGLSEDINKVSDVITHLVEESQNIGTVLDVIRGIAEQTNLLALNAAIEAARSGEQGRGC